MNKLTTAQDNLLFQMRTGAWVEPNHGGRTFIVRKAGYYSWLIRKSTLDALISADLVEHAANGRCLLKVTP